MVEIILVLIILALLAWMLFSGSAASSRKLSSEISKLRQELSRTKAANEALRERLGTMEVERARFSADICDLARDFERLRAAIAGAKTCEKELVEKYGMRPSPELVDRILASKPRVDLATKRRLAHELLVGEVGRKLLESLAGGSSIDQASAYADIPVSVGRSQVRRLQVLGYLDERLELTKRGHQALA